MPGAARNSHDVAAHAAVVGSSLVAPCWILECSCDFCFRSPCPPFGIHLGSIWILLVFEDYPFADAPFILCWMCMMVQWALVERGQPSISPDRAEAITGGARHPLGCPVSTVFGAAACNRFVKVQHLIRHAFGKNAFSWANRIWIEILQGGLGGQCLTEYSRVGRWGQRSPRFFPPLTRNCGGYTRYSISMAPVYGWLNL